MKRFFAEAALPALLVVLAARPACAQVVIAEQGFESASGTWTVVTGGGNSSTSPGSTDTPANQRIRSGTRSWQVNNGNVTLELASVSCDGYTGVVAALHLASLSVTAGNGAESSDTLTVCLATNGSAFASTHQVLVAGTNNSRWGYWGTNNVDALLGAPVTFYSPQGDTSTNNCSFIRIRLPSAVTSVALRVVAVNNSDNEVWALDDVTLSGFSVGGVTTNPPVLDPVGNKSVSEGNALSFTVTAAPTDGDPITNLWATGLPSGASFVPADSANTNGTFLWTNAGPVGVYTSTFWVADKDGLDFETITMAVSQQVPVVVQWITPNATNWNESGSCPFVASISRSGDASVEVGLGGSAEAGADYAISATTLVFSAAGPTQQTVTVSLNDDSAAEEVEVVTLVLTNAAHAAVGTNRAVSLEVRDSDSYRLVSANLSSGTGGDYQDPATRIFKGLKPDVVAIQEFNVTTATRRAYVDLAFGTNYSYSVESETNANPLPNGIISRWPITASGEWEDTLVANRDFAWATIDLPGTNDLHVISVHLYSSGSASDRDDEARAITNSIALMGWPVSDFVAICGDMNVASRTEAAIRTFTNKASDAHVPVDQLHNGDTSLNRNYPYDYVLPFKNTDSNHLPVVLGGSNFANGIVFDSRLWTIPPDPILADDSAAEGMQHMAVMKRFFIPPTTGDADGDGMPDEWERQNFGGATNASAAADDDGDGVNNLSEYIADTQPTNGASHLDLRIEVISAASNQYECSFDSSDARVYSLWRRASPTGGSWSVLRTNVAGTGSSLALTDTNSVAGGCYRVGVRAL